MTPKDRVAYEFGCQQFCRQCIADAHHVSPEEIETTLDREAYERDLNRYDHVTAGLATFPLPIWRTWILAEDPEATCTECGQLLRTAPAIVPDDPYDPSDDYQWRFNPEFETAFPTPKGMSI